MAVGTDQLRRDNVAAVLRSLRADGPATRAELAVRTGLAKATVGAIVADLEGAEAVAEGAARAGARGRPGRPVELRGRRHLGLGLELNVDYVAAVVLDLAGEVVQVETRAATPSDREQRLLELARGCLHAHPDARWAGVSLAVPGLVRSDERTVAWAPNLGLDDVDVAARVEAGLAGTAAARCAVRVANDANCASLAELHHGAAAGVSHALYLTGTVGIGAGIVVGGELMRGAAGFAGEVGHIPVGDPEAPCGCGRRGCWEAQIGLAALVPEHLGSADSADPSDPSGSAAADDRSPLALAEDLAAQAAGDPSAAQRLTRLGSDLGLGLTILAGVLDPHVVVLGGYFVPLLDHVLPTARAVLDERLGSRAQVRPELRGSVLGVHAAALGAAEQSLDRLLLDGDLAS
ncbi:ROK family transcriptional regulator [Nocardioides fonticola]|uniref:ROK family transcriptional regulator n=1 Tax=Nocardioides fonticola TaxID=450363 RepID=A0ABP7XQR7_9ACTN